MKRDGFKKDFTEFFIKNFDEIMEAEKNNEGFLVRCYTEFERVQRTNTNNRGSQRQLKPTVKKFLEYFDENKFVGITDETKPIADKIAPFFSEQTTFNYAVKIHDEQKH